MIFLASLAQDLEQPEYIHVLLNPLPVYGLGIAILGLVIALCFRSRPAKITALALVCVSAASAWPVVHYGQEGYDRVLAMEDDEGEAWLKAHMERAEKFELVYSLLAVLAVAAILVPFKWPKADAALTVLTLFLAIATMGIGAWIAYAGGKVRHSEFRNSPPPDVDIHEHSH